MSLYWGSNKIFQTFLTPYVAIALLFVSHSANKASGACSCCQTVRQLHIKDGTVHSHGPRNNLCPGSHKLPLGVASAPSNLVNQSTSSNVCSSNASHSSSPNLDGTSNSRSTNNTTTSIPSPTSKRVSQPTAGSRTVKHIPKPARSVCASILAEALNEAVKKLGDDTAWRDLLWLRIKLSASSR